MSFFPRFLPGTPRPAGASAVPWRILAGLTGNVHIPHGPFQHTADDFFHPAFLYESLWNLAVFATLIGIRRAAPSPPGTVFFLYVALYSVGHFLIEAIRIDSFWLGPFRVAQFASVVGVTLATAGLLVTRPRGPAA